MDKKAALDDSSVAGVAKLDQDWSLTQSIRNARNRSLMKGKSVAMGDGGSDGGGDGGGDGSDGGGGDGGGSGGDDGS